MKLSVYWRFVFGTCEMTTYICVYGKRSCNEFAENVRCQLKEFSLLGDQAPGIGSRLI